MSKLDRKKESINQFRIWLSMLTLTDFGLIGWLVLNFDTQPFLCVLLGTVAVIVISMLVIALEKKIRKYIEEVEEL